MNDLRKAAEMALEALEDVEQAYGSHSEWFKERLEALRQALNDKPAVKTYAGGKPNYCTPEETPEVPCKTDPDAPHGFDRNASHSADRYVCECEGWEPVDNVNMSEERVHKSDKSIHEPVAYLDEGLGAFYWANDYEKDVGFTPLYTAPPKKEWVGLTDEEIQAERHKLDRTAGWTYDHFARAIEAKLKEKNGG